MLSIDGKRARFYAAARREIYIEIPMEDGQPGDADNVARLNFSFYGTRDAAQNWTVEYTKVAGTGIRGWLRRALQLCVYKNIMLILQLLILLAIIDVISY